MSSVIRTKLHYVFVDEQLLHSALKSAHREKDDDVLDDGNRGLAHYGNLAIQMAMTYEAIIDKGKTLYDIHAQDHWSKTKKNRAKACRLLGLDSLIKRSVRQQNQPPSDTVLDHAFSAVLGAIWLDCERQEHKVSHIRSTILDVLHKIDGIVDSHLATGNGVLGVDQSIALQCNLITGPPGWHPEATELDHEDLDDMDSFHRSWFQQELDSFSLESISQQNTPMALQPLVSPNDCTIPLDYHSGADVDGPDPASSNKNSALEHIRIEPYADGFQYERQSSHPCDTEREHRTISALQDRSSFAAMTVKVAKRKRNQDNEEKSSCLYYEMLQAEQQKLMYYSQVEQDSLVRLLENPILDKLEKKESFMVRFLYLAIGSWDTIADFKDLIQLTSSNASVRRPTGLSLGNAAAMYDEICRLEREEALCGLLRRYYVIKLCEEEQLYNDHHTHIIVETASTVDGGRVARPGNPVFALDSSLTERLLFKIMPNADPGSADFQKARVKVKRLRKVAGRLRHFVKYYGVGVLGLLPSGPSFKQMSLTDNMLLSMTETRFKEFGRILHQEQGQHLMGLSRILEPFLLALVTGSVRSDTMCFREWVDNPSLVGAPKGLLGRDPQQLL